MIPRTIYLLIFPVAFIYSCKSAQNVSTDPIELILLLEEQVKPDELAAFEGLIIISQKRSSKSQNQWLVKLTLSEEGMKMLEGKLLKDPKVIEVQKTETSESQNLTNFKSSTYSPEIKN